MGFGLQVIGICGLAHAHYAELVSTDAKLAEGPKQPRRVVWERRTCKNGQYCLMDGLDLPRVEYVAREEGYYEEHNQDGQGPRCEYLLLASLWLVCWRALEMGSPCVCVERGTDRPGLRRMHRALPSTVSMYAGRVRLEESRAHTE